MLFSPAAVLHLSPTKCAPTFQFLHILATLVFCSFDSSHSNGYELDCCWISIDCISLTLVMLASFHVLVARSYNNFGKMAILKSYVHF